MDNGHAERAFFQKFESFGLGQTNWAEILGGILGISSQTIGTILALWVPCSWESVAGSFSYKKRWFLGLKHTTPKYSQNKILAVKNLEKSLRTSVFGEIKHTRITLLYWYIAVQERDSSTLSLNCKKLNRSHEQQLVLEICNSPATVSKKIQRIKTDLSSNVCMLFPIV